jgi:hypothetical protein
MVDRRTDVGNASGAEGGTCAEGGRTFGPVGEARQATSIDRAGRRLCPRADRSSAVIVAPKECGMKRKTFDVIVSLGGLFLAVVLIVAGSLLTWAHNFVNDEVHTQLAAQKIFFPPKGSPAIAAPEFQAVQKYAGQQLTTGAQAQTYADHFIANHLKAIGGGKTYSQLSSQLLANPKDAKLAATVDTMFKGETLRGLLLNAYAFGTMGTIAGIAAITAFIAAAVMLALGALGLWHARRVAPSAEVFAGHPAAGDKQVAV